MRRIVVVGASAAGLAAAETLRREGYDGTLTLVGDEPHAPYDRPPLSKQLLAARWESDRLALRTPAHLDGLGLDLRLGTAATGLDLDGRRVRLSDGDALPYDALVIATGVRPRRLPGEGAHVLRTLDDALTLRERLTPGTRLVVVGAGFLGAEAAAVGRGLGVEVTLLEPAPVPLAHAVGAEVGAVLARAHLEHGVDLRTGVPVTEVTEDGVRLADGTTVEADEVLVAIGSLPNTEWLAGSGLPVGDGVLCDRYCEAAPHVYAAGDVARWHNPLFGTTMRVEHRTNAAEQGMAVARNLLAPGERRPFAPVPYFWSDQYDLKVQAYGVLRGHDEVAVVEGDLAERRFVAVYRAGERVTGVLAAGMPPKTVRRWRQAVASGAGRRETCPPEGPAGLQEVDHGGAAARPLA
ncbi:PUTATIVE FERREDOXIN REDUCTASE [Streptomyces scabiei 87.22]|uniref:PUTATIVE FERREDOXIN REDUCTASE n=1 Tax=Streptomyces scabiei (strain 87.22) TaxID=680198 RepID=C9Z4Z6_STRSW|nr:MULTISPECIES: FAD-dependent oxidoreductase [Streptomyces]MDX2539550.1 FAD-dependent oxidoreductase [Streptomyces scabiei]MDX2578088.1 FAD-dependent oxidoreductase [Streptomyces scabiei]MDX2657497.1 FAD-dependent oxidoreductase [Streptomyces scabiei]MDX2723381.1 FAD-dependent oxidoreductase [Streptomyces scabiei]MDX2801282.1 FAD-dependent oxidoreductase [Streptomyces scabiei]